MKTVLIVIEGNVQGVFFRATAKEVAIQMQLTGWVKNRVDGNVEMRVTGTDPQIDEFIVWCWKGPKLAEVQNVTVEDIPIEVFDQFNINT